MTSPSPNFARTCDPVLKASLFPEHASTLIHFFLLHFSFFLSSHKTDRPVNMAGHKVNGACLMTEIALWWHHSCFEWLQMILLLIVAGIVKCMLLYFILEALCSIYIHRLIIHMLTYICSYTNEHNLCENKIIFIVCTRECVASSN